MKRERRSAGPVSDQWTHALQKGISPSQFVTNEGRNVSFVPRTERRDTRDQELGLGARIVG